MITVNYVIDGLKPAERDRSQSFEDPAEALAFIRAIQKGDTTEFDGWTAPTQDECDAMHAAIATTP